MSRSSAHRSTKPRLGPVDVRRVVWRAHRRLGRRAFGTVLGGLAVSALLGLGGEAVRRAVHEDSTLVTTSTIAPAVGLEAPRLTAVVTGPRSTRLSWSEPEGSPVRYVVYRGNAVRGTVTGRRFVDTGLTPGLLYTYSVAARDALGRQSPRSAVVRVTMPNEEPPTSGPVTTLDTTPPSTPTDLQARADSDDDGETIVRLAWRPSADNVAVTRYRVLRDGRQIGTTSGDTTSFTDAAPRRLYGHEYSVQAVDAADNRSERSETAKVPTPVVD